MAFTFHQVIWKASTYSIVLNYKFNRLLQETKQESLSLHFPSENYLKLELSLFIPFHNIHTFPLEKTEIFSLPIQLSSALNYKFSNNFHCTHCQAQDQI